MGPIVVDAFKVSAHNEAGWGEESVLSAVVPASPARVEAGSPSSRLIEVSWVLPSHDGGSAITHYQIDSEPPELARGTRTEAPENRTYRFSQVATEISYVFLVRACNEVGCSSAPTRSGQVAAMPPKPGAPVGPKLEYVPGLIRLSWSAPVGGGVVERYEVSSEPEGFEKEVPASQSGVEFPVDVSGLVYSFTISAKNVGGRTDTAVPSEEKTIAPTAPGPPTNVRWGRDSGTDSGILKVTWGIPNSDGGRAVEAYVVASDPPRFGKEVPGTEYSATFHVDPAGPEYRFVVSARNSVGLGPTSELPAGMPWVPIAAALSAIAGIVAVLLAPRAWALIQVVFPPERTWRDGLAVPLADLEVYRTKDQMPARRYASPMSAAVDIIRFLKDGREWSQERGSDVSRYADYSIELDDLEREKGQLGEEVVQLHEASKNFGQIIGALDDEIGTKKTALNDAELDLKETLEQLARLQEDAIAESERLAGLRETLREVSDGAEREQAELSRWQKEIDGAKKNLGDLSEQMAADLRDLTKKAADRVEQMRKQGLADLAAAAADELDLRGIMERQDESGVVTRWIKPDVFNEGLSEDDPAAVASVRMVDTPSGGIAIVIPWARTAGEMRKAAGDLARALFRAVVRSDPIELPGFGPLLDSRITHAVERLEQVERRYGKAPRAGLATHYVNLTRFLGTNISLAKQGLDPQIAQVDAAEVFGGVLDAVDTFLERAGQVYSMDVEASALPEAQEWAIELPGEVLDDWLRGNNAGAHDDHTIAATLRSIRPFGSRLVQEQLVDREFKVWVLDRLADMCERTEASRDRQIGLGLIADLTHRFLDASHRSPWK